MLTKRHDADHYTEIAIWNEGDEPAYHSYRITCMDIDYDPKTDTRQPPTARISLLTTTSATVEEVRRLIYEYETVLGLADRLQTEKRAAYQKMYLTA